MTTLLDDLLNMEPEEIWRRNERPDADGLRDKGQIYYEDVNEGDELPQVHLQADAHAPFPVERGHRELPPDPLRSGLRPEPRPQPQHPGAWFVEAERRASVFEGLDAAQRLAVEGAL